MNTSYFSADSFSDFNLFFQKNYEKWSSIFILVDSNTHQHCLADFLQGVDFNQDIEILEIEAGEESKDIEIATGLWLSLAELNADRKSLIINLGGGVVCDLGAWVAANYKRGIDFIHVPTSLLAMVDASIGGKTGVDLDGIKNLIGSFSMANAVVAYTPFLKSLPEIEWFSGYAEMLKSALIADANLWNQLKILRPEDKSEIQEYVPQVIQIKKDIVDEDFDEKGRRKSLNYGHTIGHAIEAISLERGEALTHGHSIAIGMVLANFISAEKGFLNSDKMKEINRILLSIYTPPKWLSDEKSSIFIKMQKDKKNEGNKILMVLLKDIADVLLDVEVSKIELEAALASLNKDL